MQTWQEQQNFDGSVLGGPEWDAPKPKLPSGQPLNASCDERHQNGLELWDALCQSCFRNIFQNTWPTVFFRTVRPLPWRGFLRLGGQVSQWDWRMDEGRNSFTPFRFLILVPIWPSIIWAITITQGIVDEIAITGCTVMFRNEVDHRCLKLETLEKWSKIPLENTWKTALGEWQLRSNQRTKWLPHSLTNSLVKSRYMVTRRPRNCFVLHKSSQMKERGFS